MYILSIYVVFQYMYISTTGDSIAATLFLNWGQQGNVCMWHRAASVTTRHYHHAIKTPRCIVVGKILQGYSLSMTIYSICCCHVMDIVYVLYYLCILCANFNLGNLFMGIPAHLKAQQEVLFHFHIGSNTTTPVEGLQIRRSSLVKLRSLKYTYITSCTIL